MKAIPGQGRYADIILAAGRLFAEHGFAGTSLQDIADAVGVLKGSLYHHIRSKEELLFEIVKVAHQGLHENIQLADRFASDPVRQLIAFSYGHITLNATAERIDRGIVFMRDIPHLAEEQRDTITHDRDVYDRYLRSILIRGQAAGLFDADLDPKICAFSILGVLTSYMRWFKPGGSIRSEQVGRESALFILNSLAAGPNMPRQLGAIIDEVVHDMTPPAIGIAANLAPQPASTGAPISASESYIPL